VDSAGETRLELTIRLAREAGGLQRERYETPLEIRSKSVDIDLVTEVDRACEALIGGEIESLFPDDAILAEEGGGTDFEDPAWRWIVDPLDGTTNYAHGYPRFCVSIGVERDGERAIGVVYDPLLDELYQAARGEGAQKNGSPLRVSDEPDLRRALLATGFAYDRRQSRRENVEHFAAFLQATRAMRRDGSAALDLCYVAAGRLDGYWELKLAPWDVAAGYLIVEEAGGRISNMSGGPAFGTGREVVASNGHIHEAMLQVLQSSRT
jgi:myo-inositol-1(or 4)-monophosphatase